MNNDSKTLIKTIKKKRDSVLLEKFLTVVESQLKKANTDDDILDCVVETLNNSFKVKSKHDKKHKYRNALLAYDYHELIHDQGFTKKEATRQIAKTWFAKELKNENKQDNIISQVKKITRNKSKLINKMRKDRQLYAEYKYKYWQSIHPTPFLVDGYIEFISDDYFKFMGDDLKYLN